MAAPVVLCVIGGLGVRKGTDANALHEAKTPHLDALAAEGHRAELKAATVEERGSGAVGFLTLGAGRTVVSGHARFDELVRGGRMAFSPAIDNTVRQCMAEGKLHLVGLLSDAGLHGHVDHLYALVDHFLFNDVEVVVHGILDGRDVPPRSGLTFVDRFLGRYEEEPRVTLGTLSGRNYALDADGRWDRTYRCFHAMVRDKVLGDKAPQEDDPLQALRSAYERGLDDAWFEPTRIGDYRGFEGNFVAEFGSKQPVWCWTGFDVGFVATTRADRSRQLVAMLTRKGVPDEVALDLLTDRDRPVLAFENAGFYTLADHGHEIPCVLKDEPVPTTLGEVVAAAGKTQARVGETEGERHVGRHFSGYRDAPFDGERRFVAKTPKLVERWQDRPALATAKVTKQALAAIADHDFVLVHYVAPDAVAHTGDYAATVASIEAVDEAVGQLRKAAAERGAHLLVTSSHGNTEEMRNDHGDVAPGHTAAKVPLWSTAGPLASKGHLRDVAPMVLQLLGIDVPDAMAGTSLIDEESAEQT